MHHQEELGAGEKRDRREFGEGVEGLLAEVRVDGEHVVWRDEPGVAVGRALRHHVGADVLAATGAVLDHQGLRPDRLQTLREHACNGVGRPAGRQRNDDPHRLRGILLGESRA